MYTTQSLRNDYLKTSFFRDQSMYFSIIVVFNHRTFQSSFFLIKDSSTRMYRHWLHVTGTEKRYIRILFKCFELKKIVTV